ncbi:hypothetical protein HXA34_20245 [Salipaludibacillus agaradhaerens]|jgi:hypothetical protein|uniref:hypothetical protein n=1 Tax=Salipaludibacillus agaradhaerens TaxID=76935 RepID=UPI002151177C|nr:hypothetical protein [Salipaludibacillus agaradhaerens]MCR6108626.1 hypothetical protein [Salipaludibacillus agaradhaerens]MCR6120652.1 hypothetical protein [Salipaludibacillus agaradhaerens]
MTALIDKLTIKNNGNDEKLDRRVKLTTEDKNAIRTQYFETHKSQRPTMTWLAATYGVDRRLIQFILFPERETRHKEQSKVRRKSGRYYDKEKGRKNMQRYREYKRGLAKAGRLKPSERDDIAQ